MDKEADMKDRNDMTMDTVLRWPQQAETQDSLVLGRQMQSSRVRARSVLQWSPAKLAPVLMS